MSLILPSDLEASLPSVAITQRQALIDRAEAEVASRIGRSTRQAAAPNVVVLPNEADVESGGGGDSASPPNVTSPLGQADEKMVLVVNHDTRYLEFDTGPVLSMSVAKAGTESLSIPDFILSPWSWEYLSPLSKFTAFVEYTLTVKTGWLRNEVPDPVRRAIELQVLLLAKSSDTAGTEAKRDVIAEATDDYSVRFAQDAKAAPAGALDTSVADSRIGLLLAPWSRLDGI